MIPVDLFPHNPQFELVILFERVSGAQVRERLMQPPCPIAAAAEAEEEIMNIEQQVVEEEDPAAM